MSDFKTFIDSRDTDKINDFYRAGFYAADTMLVMELSLKNRPERHFDCLSQMEKYDTSDLKEYLKANGKGFGVPDPVETVREQLSNPNSSIVVLREKGKIASSITCWDIDKETLATENIFTVPKCREKGYAGFLLNSVLSAAEERGMKKARLTVYASDIPAIKMYYSFGFTITKVLEEFRHE